MSKIASEEADTEARGSALKSTASLITTTSKLYAPALMMRREMMRGRWSGVELIVELLVMRMRGGVGVLRRGCGGGAVCVVVCRAPVMIGILQ